MAVYSYLYRTTINLIIVSCLCIYTDTVLGNAKSWFSRYKHTEEQLIELTPKQTPCTLCITHELPGNITLKGWHQNHIAVTVHKKTNTPEDAERIHCTLIHHKNGTVAFTTQKNDELHKQAAIDLTVHVPYRTTIIIETTEDVSVENTRNTVRIKTVAGTITTDATHGPVHAQVDRGNIMTHHAHGSLDLYTQKGSIVIKDNYNNVRAETERGSIQVGCTEIPSTATICLTTHKYGAVTLTVPESTQAHLVADTTREIITSDVLITVERHTTLLNINTYKDAQKHVRGIIGEQGNANIIINSARGVHIAPAHKM